MFDSALAHHDKRPGTREMTIMLAGLMALNALAIDSMIPALPQIGRSLAVSDENARQLVVILYIVGFGSTQLLWGPLADRFGRKIILITGLALYAFFALVCGVATSFSILLTARILQGASAAVSRVLVVAMVRDLFEGEDMAKVMSLVFMTFMLVPVVAPNIGQAILLFGSWRAIFYMLAGYAVAMLLWSALRLPETLRSEHRRSLHWRHIVQASLATVRDPQSRGYTIAMTLTFGTLVAYISSIQEIVFDAFHAGAYIGIVFASIAAPMALSSWGNSRIVGRYGLRRVGHSGALALALITSFHAALASVSGESLAQFMLLQALAMAAFAFTSSNLSTLAMEHMAKIAGTASSLQGLVSTTGGALIGYLVGQQFNGTSIPFLLGTAISAILAFLAIMLTEPKRLFARRQLGLVRSAATGQSN